MPNALEQQQRLLAGQSRFPPARPREEDTSSVISWNTVQSNAADPDTDEELPMPPADLKVSRMDPINEHAPSADRGQPSAAPATQAARNLVDHTNETNTCRSKATQATRERSEARS